MKHGLTILIILLVSFVLPAQAEEDKSEQCPSEAVQNFGQVFYDEIMIDKPVDAVWKEIFNYPNWQVGHTDATHITIKGKPREVGEIVKIIKVRKGKSQQPYFAETVRLRKNRNVVWRVFTDTPGPCTDAVGTSAYLDFRTEDIDGKTLFTTNYYASWPIFGEDLNKLRQGQLRGEEGVDFLRQGGEAFKEYMEKL